MVVLDKRDIMLVVLYCVSIFGGILLISNAYIMLAENEFKFSWFSPTENILYLFNLFGGIGILFIIFPFATEHYYLHSKKHSAEIA
jgi:hypothetical protein